MLGNKSIAIVLVAFISWSGNPAGAQDAKATPAYHDGGSPNNDTLYSIAWIDVSKEPLILSHPDMGERYFTFDLAGIDSDNFAYVGTLTTGDKAGSFALVEPDWKGTLPDGVTAFPPSRTNSILSSDARSLTDRLTYPPSPQASGSVHAHPSSPVGKKDAVLSASRDVGNPST